MGADLTLFVPGGEDDHAGFVSDDALGDARGASARRGGGAPLLEHRFGADHLHDQGVAARARLELIYLRENRFPQRWPLALRRHGR